MGKNIKVLFASSTLIGCRFIDLLSKAENIDLVMVVAATDKHGGRGRELRKNSVSEYCGRNDLNVFQPDDINSPESVKTIRGLSPDLAIVVDYGQILSKEILDIFPLGSYNCHYSILPDLRGAEPVRWALIKGYTKTGITLIKMNEELDAGQIAGIRTIGIADSDNYDTLKSKLTDEALILLTGLVDDICCKGNVVLEPQKPVSELFYARKLNKEFNRINWTLSSREIVNIIRALSPYPGAYSILKNQDLRLKFITVETEDHNGSLPGEIVEVEKGYFTVSAKTGNIRVIDVQPAGKRIMSAREFIAGNAIKPGDVFQ